MMETSVLVNDSLARSWIAVAQQLVLLLSAGVVLRAMLSPDCHGSSRIIAVKGCLGSASVMGNLKYVSAELLLRISAGLGKLFASETCNLNDSLSHVDAI